MTPSLQVLYPTDGGSTFDHDYYSTNHMKIVAESFGRFIKEVVITRGVSGCPDQPAGYHAIATITFADQGAMDSAVAEIGPAVADIANFYDGKPKMLFGNVVGD